MVKSTGDGLSEEESTRKRSKSIGGQNTVMFTKSFLINGGMIRSNGEWQSPEEESTEKKSKSTVAETR